MEGDGGYGLDWRDLLKSTPSGMGMSLGTTRDGRMAQPTRVHSSVNMTPKSWPDTKRLGKGSGARRVNAFSLAGQFSVCETCNRVSVEDLRKRKVSLDFALWQG